MLLQTKHLRHKINKNYTILKQTSSTIKEPYTL